MGSRVMLDLAKKCGDDVSAAMLRTIDLAETNGDKLCIAVSGAALAMATLKGVIAAVHNLSEEDAARATVAILSQMATPEGMAKLIEQAKA